jgi:outer membrane protein
MYIQEKILMLRNFFKVMGLGIFLIAPAMAVEVKIGVIDTQKAIMQTIKAKNMSDKFIKDFTKDEEKVKKIQSELEALNEKVKKSGVAPSKEDQAAFKNKSQSRAEIINKIKHHEQERLKELRAAVDPKIKDIMKEIAEKGGYTIIIDKVAAPYYDEADDVTQQATEKLNQVLK